MMHGMKGKSEEKKRQKEVGRKKRRPEYMNDFFIEVLLVNPIFYLIRVAVALVAFSRATKVMLRSFVFSSNLRLEIFMQIKELIKIQEKCLHLPLVHMYSSSICLLAMGSYLVLLSNFPFD